MSILRERYKTSPLDNYNCYRVKMQEKFNQTEYIREYNKKHYSYFKVQLKKEEVEELEKLLKKLNMSKPDFVRRSIEILKEKKSK